ncbi:MAG TPA: hypothetical protein VL200_06360 [Lacunisphaera sp.]|jgi:hypothetical protein|nr:hypothetical protein [Lacunisphaera sp.]
MLSFRSITLAPGRAAAAAILLALGGLGGGCTNVPVDLAASPAGRVKPATGRILTGAEVGNLAPRAMLCEQYYAEVNSAWLDAWYQLFRRQLYDIGFVHWDERFDCNRFTDCYTNLAQAYFALENFQSRTPARALALGPFWYRPEHATSNHAIVQAITERGRIFIDPQTGQEMHLTAGEERSAFWQMF